MRTIDDCLTGNRNNFDLLRLLAALMVLWGHSYPLTLNGQNDITTLILFGYDLGGSFAVAIFFIISGFLVTRSAATRNVPGYLLARCLRIFPALIVCVVVTVLVIGPLLTKLSWAQYFNDPSTTAYLGNALIYDLHFYLADTTQALPYPWTINGSLWTLSIEFSCYLVVLILVKWRAMQTSSAVLTLGLTVAGLLYCVYWLHLDWQRAGPNLYRGLTLYPILKNFTFFMLGGGLWVYRRQIPLSKWIALAGIMALAMGRGTMAAQAIYFFSLPYLVVYASIGLPRLVNLSETVGDLSYGIYLFAFPVQQTTISFLGPAARATTVSMIATAVVIVLASLSWRLVERPALKLKLSVGAWTAPAVGVEPPVALSVQPPLGP